MIRTMSDSGTSSENVAVRLGALEVDLAPPSPGIYAWYARLALAENDWKPRVRGNTDAAASDLTAAVSDYCRVHHPCPVHLRGDGSYGLNWSGTLSRESVVDDGSHHPDSRLDKGLGDIPMDPNKRRILSNLLRASAPVFASPLYIGVATNLRVRLNEHKVDYENAKILLRNKPSSAAKMQFEGEASVSD